MFFFKVEVTTILIYSNRKKNGNIKRKSSRKINMIFLSPMLWPQLVFYILYIPTCVWKRVYDGKWCVVPM